MTALVDQVLGIDAGFERARIPHAFGGAIALAYCISQARATSDIDVNVFVSPDRADAVLDVLPRAVVVTDEDRRVAARDGQVRVMWERTPVDVFFAYHPFHDLAASRCRVVPFGDATIPVLDCTDLTVFKAFFARTRDWADIETMAQAATVDIDDALRWVGDLLGTDNDRYQRLEQVLRHPPREGPPPRLPRSR